MPYVNLQQEQQVGLQAVRAACRVCAAVRAEMVTPESLAKKDKSPVTVADFAAQAVINWHLSQAFPSDPIVAEEDAAQLAEPAQADLRSRVLRHVQAAVPIATHAALLDLIARGGHGGGAHGRFWTVDPIDGTKGFLRGEQYAVALALIDSGRILLGILGCPNLPFPAPGAPAGTGGLAVAVCGGGARIIPFPPGDAPSSGAVAGPGPAHDPQALAVAGTRDPRQAVFCESVESGHTSHDDAARVAAILEVSTSPVRMDSQCKYAAVARGDASVYLRLPTRPDYQEKIWDHAAGAIIVEEAGGRVTDVAGRPLDFSLGRTLQANRGVVATNAHLHDAILSALRHVGVR